MYYTPLDGLINSRVRSIKQDSHGRMLFLTYGGLSVYDGVKFNNYNPENGLANELVNDIIQITQDSFLVATNCAIVNTLAGGKLGQFHTSDNFYPIVNRFHKSIDGVLYTIADDGLYKLVENKFIRIPLVDSAGHDIGRNLDRITEWNNYFFLVPWNFLQKEKLIIYDKHQKKVVATVQDKRIISVAVSPKNELWLSSNEGIQVLDFHSLQMGKVKLEPVGHLKPEESFNNAFIYFDPNKDVWIFQNNEVLKIAFDGEKQLFSNLQGLKTSNLATIFVDREDNVWMGSDGNGIVKISGTTIKRIDELIPGIKTHVFAIHQHADTIWTFNYSDQSFYRICEKDITPFSIGATTVRAVNIMTHGKSLFYLSDARLYRILNKDDPASYRNPIPLFHDTIKTIELGAGLVDQNGMIIQSVRRDANSFYLAVIKDQKVLMKSPLSFMVDHMALDKKGHLWIPTRDNQLLVYALHPESPDEYLQLVQDYSSHIAGINPRAITIDDAGNVWIGTRYNGIYRYEVEANKIISTTRFTIENGLTDNFQNYLHAIGENEIWAGSQTGIDKIFLKDSQFVIENITKSKGIFQGIARIVNFGKNEIWAATTNGSILSMAREAVHAYSQPPPLLINYLAVNDKEVTSTSTVYPYNQNNISISIAASSFLDEKSIRYSYKLEGGNQHNWSIPSNNASFNFLNLAPGEYSLLMKAEFPAQIYPEQFLEYSFVIKPPYWNTWWFYLLVGIFFLALLGYFVREHYQRKLGLQKVFLENKQAIEKERTRIATDMHDDLGAGLSRIKFLSEIIGIKKQQLLPVDEELNTIRYNANDMIDKMGEIVWALNEKNDSLSDLLSFTRAYAVEYIAESGLKGHIGKIPIGHNTVMSGDFRRNIYLSVKEILHNVVKHAKANNVTIQFEATDKLIISINDDGVGFDHNNTTPFRNGLPNIKKRMADIGGQVEFFNNQGTQIKLTIPLAT